MTKLSRHTFIETLNNTLSVFNEKIMPLPSAVEVKFQSKEEYMKAVKENPLIQQQIQLGMYKDIDKEYVGFAVVYEKDKFPLRTLMGLPFVITICDEIAKNVLKPFKPNEVKVYLTHVFIHELTHIFDSHLKEHRKDIWEKSLSETNGNEAMANELFAENIANLVSKDNALYKSVEERLWSGVFRRVNQIRKQRGL